MVVALVAVLLYYRHRRQAWRIAKLLAALEERDQIIHGIRQESRSRTGLGVKGDLDDAIEVEREVLNKRMQLLVRNAQELLGADPAKAGKSYREAATIASELGKGEMGDQKWGIIFDLDVCYNDF